MNCILITVYTVMELLKKKCSQVMHLIHSFLYLKNELSTYYNIYGSVT